MKIRALPARRNLTDELADSVRKLVSGVNWDRHAYLPAERELVDQYKVSRVTVRRSLALLVEEGVLEAVASKGYRLKPRVNAESATNIIAYVLVQAEPGARWDPSHAHILNAFQQAHVAQSGSMLAVGCKGRSATEVFKELLAARVQGVLLDTSKQAYIEAARDSGLPFVIVDAHAEEPVGDVVLQDNFDGVRQGTMHLLGKRHERIGWVGPNTRLGHWRERFAGARAALNDAGRDFLPQHLAVTETQEEIETASRLVREMLARPDRPTALVCPWVQMTIGAAQGIREAGLKVGRDVELVAWANADDYRESLAPAFLGEDIPATMVWKPSEMAQLALGRLRERRANPNGPACRLDVRVTLVQPRAADAVVRHGWNGSV